MGLIGQLSQHPEGVLPELRALASNSSSERPARDSNDVGALSLLSNPPEMVERLSIIGRDVGSFDRGEYVVRPQTGEEQTRLTAYDELALCSSYQAGASVRELAEGLGVHRTTVSGCLKRHGVATRPNVRKLTDGQVKRAAVQNAEGISITSLARGLGVDPETLRKELKRLAS